MSQVIIGVGAIVGAVVAAATGNWVLAAELGLIGAGALFGPKPAPPLSEQQGFILENRVGADQPIPIVYGRTRMAGVLVDKRIDQASTDNKRYVVVVAFCVGSRDNGDIDAIQSVYFDDRLAINDPGNVQAPFSTTVEGEGATKHLEYAYHLGSTTQVVDSRLNTLFPTSWPSTAPGKHIAYARFELWFDRDIYPTGLPQIRATIRGRRVFDPRDSQWKYSDNPALCVRDYLLDPIHGLKIPSANLDEQSFIDVANYCDEIVSLPGGLEQKRYTLNGWVDTSRDVYSNLAELAATCRGAVVNEGDKWRLVVRRQQAVSGYKLNEDTMVEGQWSFATVGLREAPNIVRCTYIDPDRDYQAETVQWPEPGAANAYLTEDNGLESRLEIDLPYVTSRLQAQHTGMTLLKEMRQSPGMTAVLKESAVQCRVGDVVEVTQPTPGWTDKKFWVRILKIRPDAQVEAILSPYEPTVYDLDSQQTQPSVPPTDLPNPFTVAAPTNFALVAGDAESTVSVDGIRLAQIKATWMRADEAFLDHYEIQAKKTADSNWDQWGTPLRSDTQFFVGPVTSESWDVRIRAINSIGVASAWVQESVTPNVTPSAAISALEFDPRAYGAVMNGVANDTAAIQAAIDAAAALGGGIVKFAPKPTVASQLKLKTRVGLAGSGWKSELIQKANSHTQEDSGTSSGGNTSTTLNDTSKAWSANQFAPNVNARRQVKITGGAGSGQIRTIVSNTGTQLTIDSAEPWSTTPDATSTYIVVNALHLIILDTVNVEQTIVRDLKIFGNKANQVARADAIRLDNTGGGPFDTGDMQHLVSNVLVKEPHGDGLRVMGGARETQLQVVVVQAAGGYGINLKGATDSKVLTCIAQGSGLSGFNLDGGADQVVGCKAFNNGHRAISGNRAGYIISQSGVHLADCMAQENPERGFHVLNANRCALAGCVADSNGAEGVLFDNADANIVEGLVCSRTTGLAYTQPEGVEFINGSANNRVSMQSDSVATPVVVTSDLANNDVVVDAVSRTRRFNRAGSISQSTEHFTFGKVGSPAAGNPYYAWSTDASGTPIGVLSGWDGATSKTFIRADFANNKLVLGNPTNAAVEVEAELSINAAAPLVNFKVSGAQQASLRSLAVNTLSVLDSGGTETVRFAQAAVHPATLGASDLGAVGGLAWGALRLKNDGAVIWRSSAGTDEFAQFYLSSANSFRWYLDGGKMELSTGALFPQTAGALDMGKSDKPWGQLNIGQAGSAVGSTPKIQWWTAAAATPVVRAFIQPDHAVLGDLKIQTEGGQPLTIAGGSLVLDGAGRVINFDDANAVIQRAGETKLILGTSDHQMYGASGVQLRLEDAGNLESANAFVSYVWGADSAGTQVWFVGDGSPTGKIVALWSKAGYNIEIIAHAATRATFTSGSVTFSYATIANARFESAYGTAGSSSDEHFKFGKSGSGASGNPYFVWSTDNSGVPIGRLGSWDGATARTFIRAQHGGGGQATRVVLGALDDVNQVLIDGHLLLQESSPAQITANQNDYSVGNASWIRLTSDNVRNITGIAGGAADRVLLLTNVGNNDINLTHEDVASAAANRVITPDALTWTLNLRETAILIYDNNPSRWRILAGHGGGII